MGELLRESLINSIRNISGIIPLVRTGVLDRRAGSGLVVKLFPESNNDYEALCACVKEGIIAPTSPWVRQVFAEWLSGHDSEAMYAAVACQVFTKEEVKPFFFMHASRGKSLEFFNILHEAYQRDYITGLEYVTFYEAHFHQEDPPQTP